MKNWILLLCAFFIVHATMAQQTYSVDGTSYELKTEISGKLTLLWNTINNEFRYFIQKGDEIVELKNTKSDGRSFNEEYKSTLARLTSDQNMSVDKLKLTLPSLRGFVFDYNKASDPAYSETNNKPSVGANILAFAGISNSPFVENPDNISTAVFGAEIEVYEANTMPRHAIYFQLRHTSSNDDFAYSNTQMGLGYRFRFVNLPKINFYANVILATYSFTETEVIVEDQVIAQSSNGFDAPLYFGIGTDIKIGDKSYLTITYDELVAIALENEGNFSTNVSIGFKLKL